MVMTLLQAALGTFEPYDDLVLDLMSHVWLYAVFTGPNREEKAKRFLSPKSIRVLVQQSKFIQECEGTEKGNAIRLVKAHDSPSMVLSFSFKEGGCGFRKNIDRKKN